MNDDNILAYIEAANSIYSIIDNEIFVLMKLLKDNKVENEDIDHILLNIGSNLDICKELNSNIISDIAGDY